MCSELNLTTCTVSAGSNLGQGSYCTPVEAERACRERMSLFICTALDSNRAFCSVPGKAEKMLCGLDDGDGGSDAGGDSRSHT